jgi:hypothetical protein
MMVQISSQGIVNRFSIDRLYLSDEFFHHHQPPHKNKKDDHEDDNNISVRSEISAKGNEGYCVLILLCFVLELGDCLGGKTEEPKSETDSSATPSASPKHHIQQPPQPVKCD